jgi:hypothetical protein
MARAASTLTNSANGIVFKPIERISTGSGLSAPGELINSYTGVPYLEANSQEFKAGDMVYLNAGAVTQVLTGDTVAMVGFALTDATNVTTGNAQIRIMPVNTNDIYAINVYSGTEGNSNWDNIMTTTMGGVYNLVQVTVTEVDGSTTYCTAVNIDSSAQARVKIVGVQVTPEQQSGPSTKSYVRALVKFESALYTSGTATNYYRNLQG